jgi:hypothetical protein
MAAPVALLALLLAPSLAWANDICRRVPLTPAMLTCEEGKGDPGALVDEQGLEGDPRLGSPRNPWTGSWQEAEFPLHAVLDLGREVRLHALWLHDTSGEGAFTVEIGQPGQWRELVRDGLQGYDQWKEYVSRETTRYLRFTKGSGGANVGEILLFERAEPPATPRAQRLVDRVACGSDTEHQLVEYPAGVSRVEAILGKPFRVLPSEGEAKYYAYRLGAGKGLVPGRAYLLEVDYPEDASRSMFILNRGAETVRGFHTGTTVGDALHGKYVGSNPESLRIPLSGRVETWRTLFYLHDRFAGLRLVRDAAERPETPEGGFLVIVAQLRGANDPTSRGAAVSEIRLYEAPEDAYDVPLPKLPDGLPQRRLFVREEMADGVVASEKARERGVLSRTDWYEYKLRLLRSLGMDTFCKDLLEFGHNQGWDSAPYGGSDWVNQTPYPMQWHNTLTMVGDYGMPVLPYYEYAGSRGAHGYGGTRPCVPLGGNQVYTHVTWCEEGNADVTDPVAREDIRKILDCTIGRERQTARFVGAWLRPRPSSMPVSFSDPCLARFAAETGRQAPPTREGLAADKPLYAAYMDWWMGKRRDFLEAVRDDVRRYSGDPTAFALLTTDTSEGGQTYPDWNGPTVVTDDPAAWAALGEKPLALAEAISQGRQLAALTSPLLTWDSYEWQHSAPQADPQDYKGTEGVMLTYTMNRAYTVGSPESLEAFRAPAGLTVVRHCFLNENEMNVGDEDPLGYFAADMDLAGPYCMLPEARAVANGDPWAIGYLSASCFTRGFPEATRDFNLAFLALPALPSRVVEGAADDPEVVVRLIETTADGAWLAVVNTGLVAKERVHIRIPVPGSVSNAVTGDAVASQDGAVTLSLGACQLVTLRVAG